MQSERQKFDVLNVGAPSPAFTRRWGSVVLERQLHTKLNLPRRAQVTANRARGGNAPEISRILRPVGLVKIRVIENIESLSTELQVDAFLDWRVL